MVPFSGGVTRAVGHQKVVVREKAPAFFFTMIGTPLEKPAIWFLVFEKHWATPALSFLVTTMRTVFVE